MTIADIQLYQELIQLTTLDDYFEEKLHQFTKIKAWQAKVKAQLAKKNIKLEGKEADAAGAKTSSMATARFKEAL